MTIRTACITAGAAALALPAFAENPKGATAALNTPSLVQPIAAAKYTVIDGRMVLTTPWLTNDGPSTRGPVWSYRFDSIEITGPNPNEGQDFTDICGLGGARYLLYVNDQPTWDYCNPFITNDMSSMGAGTIDGMYVLWYQRAAVPPAPPVPGGEQLYIAVEIYEDTLAADCGTGDAAQFHDGVIINFGVNPQGFWYGALDLSGFGIQIPPLADNTGSVKVIMGSVFDDVTGEITLSTCTQPGLWGTQPGRVGTQHYTQMDDDAPIDGVHDPLVECYDYAAYGVICPSTFGIAIGLMGMDGTAGCPCPGDTNGDNLRDIADLAVLLSAFGASPPPAGAECADLDGNGIVDLADLAALLALFGSTC